MGKSSGSPRGGRKLLFFIAALLFASGCGDLKTPSPTASDLASIAEARTGDESSPYGCFVSEVAADSLPVRYRYYQLPVEFPSDAQRPDGRTVEYQFRLEDPGEEPVLLANCVIPGTRHAVRVLEARLRVPADVRYSFAKRPNDGLSTMTEPECDSKVGDIYDENDTCFTLAPVVAVGRAPTGPGTGQASSPTTGPIVSVDPNQLPTGGSGGPSPCWTCQYGDPLLVCPADVVRGNIVTCSLTTKDELAVTVVQWLWVDATGTDSVRGSHTESVWEGRAVHGGTVTARVSDSGGGLRDLQSSFAVSNRGWRFDSSKWSFVQGGAPVCYSEPTTIAGFTAGWNRSLDRCTGVRISPDPETDSINGYSVAQVTDDGPNRGWWYVTAASYRMDRGSKLNANVLPGGPRFVVSNPAQAQECRNGGLTGATVYANFYEFNRYCKGLDMDGFINAAWAHEGFGSNGNNGHESVARQFVSVLAHDPYAGIEPIVARTESWVRAGVRNQAWQRAADLTNHAADHRNGTSGNWSGTLWLYDPGTGAFVSTSHSM